MMEFMSLATSGSFLARFPEIEPSEPYLYEMNIYHEAFLSWSFRLESSFIVVGACYNENTTILGKFWREFDQNLW